jgi:hypothetical protein
MEWVSQKAGDGEIKSTSNSNKNSMAIEFAKTEP